MPSAARSASAVLLACALGLVLVAQPSWAAIKLASPTTTSFDWKGDVPNADSLYEKDSDGTCVKLSGTLQKGGAAYSGATTAVLKDSSGHAYQVYKDETASTTSKPVLPFAFDSFPLSDFKVKATAVGSTEKVLTKLYTDSTCTKVITALSYVGANQLLSSDPAWTATGKQAMGGSAFILMGISVQGDNNNGQSVVPCGLPATFQFTSKCGAGKPVLSSFVLSPVSSNEYVYVPDQANSSPFVFQGTCSITVGSDVIPLNYVATHPAASTFTVDLTPGTFVNDLSGAGNLRLTFLHVSSMFRSYW